MWRLPVHFELGAAFDTGHDSHLTEARCGPTMGNRWTSTDAWDLCTLVRSCSAASLTLRHRLGTGLVTP